MVFLLGAGAAHFELIVRRRLNGGDVVLRRLVRLVGNPQDELIERHHDDRNQILPTERNDCGQGSDE
jgi:hypothetical protein